MNSIYKMVFSEDLKFGQIYEDKYQKRMIECFGKLVEKAPNKIFKDYDYIFENGSVEVKADRMVEKTGNFFVEFECNKRSSGISATKATHYLLINSSKEDDAYLVETKTLLTLTTETNCKVVHGGDGNRSKGYLVEKYKLKRFKII